MEHHILVHQQKHQILSFSSASWGRWETILCYKMRMGKRENSVFNTNTTIISMVKCGKFLHCQGQFSEIQSFGIFSGGLPGVLQWAPKKTIGTSGWVPGADLTRGEQTQRSTGNLAMWYIYIYSTYIHIYIYNIIVIVIIIVVIIIVIIVTIIINKYIYIYCSVILATNFCEWCPHLRQNCSYIDSHVSLCFYLFP